MSISKKLRKYFGEPSIELDRLILEVEDLEAKNEDLERQLEALWDAMEEPK